MSLTHTGGASRRGSAGEVEGSAGGDRPRQTHSAEPLPCASPSPSLSPPPAPPAAIPSAPPEPFDERQMEEEDEDEEEEEGVEERHREGEGGAAVGGLDAFGRVPMKVAVVGDSAVGKTCLVTRFVEGKYDEDYIETLGECSSGD
uniref:Uncharacterized protein n=1 Tax=Chromera velia CCMP2878 TaxID=1169474 RepID=A0A0G4HZR8_9ALVE|eukprot:Cvel_34105.t1-p1 / transcript=Cvel_34105.t1 / gene=Cvel_34105 / organism=Chromera_velia_CCMP2878 / gene_product=hypothetical protein / transcript_product=hypothetical protein / location=Cvel_scaffold5748:337-1083(-) / protein_length=144 / sequence_SO=supercontig / SO=protein_coding / is_pseudo=false